MSDKPSITPSGPAQLRHIAKQRGLPLLSKELNQLAALWEQDLIPTALEANWHRIADERAAEIVRLSATLKRARALLRPIQFIQEEVGVDGEYDPCPACGSPRYAGHTETCEIAAVLEGGEARP